MKIERKDIEEALIDARQLREKAMATVNLHQGSVLAYENMLAVMDAPEPEEGKPPAPTDPPDTEGPTEPETPKPADPVPEEPPTEKPLESIEQVPGLTEDLKEKGILKTALDRKKPAKGQ